MLVAARSTEETGLVEEAASLLAQCEAAGELSDQEADLLRWARQSGA
jgi:hypothetical protein